MDQEPKNSEILETIHTFANHVEERFVNIDNRFDNMNKRFDSIESDVSVLKSDVSVLKSDVSEIKPDVATLKNQMVTKDYLDNKLADLKGDLILLIKKEDKKLGELVEILREKNLLNDEDLKRIIGMEPFPKTT